MSKKSFTDKIIEQILTHVKKEIVKDKFYENIMLPLLLYVNQKVFPYFILIVVLFLVIIAILLYILYLLNCVPLT